jgi:hypothetical protein
MDKDGIIKELAERNAKLEEELQATKERNVIKLPKKKPICPFKIASP